MDQNYFRIVFIDQRFCVQLLISETNDTSYM